MSDQPHAHSHASHGHAHGRGASRRRLAISLALAASYMVAEAVGGWWTGSLALLADAGHMLSDVASLALAMFALWIAERPATTQRTYGHARAEILAALAQGAALVAVALLVSIEAFERLSAPPDVAGFAMIWIATGGLLVNLVSLRLLSGHTDNFSVRGAWLHVLSDTLGSVGAIGAGVCLFAFGWRWADPVASLLISALVLASAWRLLREAVDVLMEAAPRHLDVDEIRRSLAALPAVVEVHDLHVWMIGSGEVSLSSHLVAGSGSEAEQVLGEAHALLRERFGLGHATLQIESEGYQAPDEAGCAPVCDAATAEGS